MNHRGPAAIQARDQIRRLDENSARNDSPDGGLAAIRERNQQAIVDREQARERQTS